MLMYGYNPFVVPSDTLIWNLSSLSEKYPDPGITPPNNLGAISNYDFDQKYAQYIFTDDAIFIRFFGNIIAPLYNGLNVYLLIGKLNYLINNDWPMEIAESVIKLIQQRYGINGMLVNDQDDYELAINTKADDTFDPSYINILDADKGRYEYFMSMAANRENYE